MVKFSHMKGKGNPRMITRKLRALLGASMACFLFGSAVSPMVSAEEAEEETEETAETVNEAEDQPAESQEEEEETVISEAEGTLPEAEEPSEDQALFEAYVKDGEGKLVMTGPFDLCVSYWQNGYTLYLLSDVTVCGKSYVFDEGDFTLDLTGHTLTGKDTDTLFVVKENTKVPSESNSVRGKLDIVSSKDGGAILAENGRVAEVKGSPLPGVGGILQLQSGTLTGNTAENGGAVKVSAGGIFNMNGGVISDSTARNGAGVYVADFGTFTLNDGMIKGNSASENGGGVYADGVVTVAGGPTVRDNFRTSETESVQNNVYLVIRKFGPTSWIENKLLISSDLDLSAYLGLSVSDYKKAAAQGMELTTSLPDAERAGLNFVSDDDRYEVIASKTNAAIFAEKTYDLWVEGVQVFEPIYALSLKSTEPHASTYEKYGSLFMSVRS